uniref:Ig-like domain-containing protein n=1 Tax=Oryzias latipes TaxID=8090 RepID=A0A3P9HHB3_ORYLA
MPVEIIINDTPIERVHKHVFLGVIIDDKLSKHSLKFFLTETSGETNFTEFDGIATVDNIEIGHCDNINVKAKPKQDWEILKQRPTHIDWYTHNCVKTQHILKANLNNLKQHLNQTEGLHVLQRMNGCEWDDESNKVTGFIQYGYDGEDLLTLDLQTKTWTSPKAQADVKKYLTETDTRRTDLMKAFLMSECPDLLQTYVRSDKSFLERTERPSVSFLQKTPSSPVCCHATGFYPDRADLFWRKDGKEIHEGVEKGQILPNHDGTFQMSSELNVSLIKHEDWRRYDCVFQLSGLTEDIVSTLNKTQIQTNWGKKSQPFCPSMTLALPRCQVLLGNVVPLRGTEQSDASFSTEPTVEVKDFSPPPSYDQNRF